jgi:hypothetical protein
MIYSDLSYKPQTDNTPGTTITAWAIPFDDIYIVPGYPLDPIYMDEMQIIYDDFIPHAYKTFYKIYATSDTGKVDDNKLTGETAAYESLYEFYFPKNDNNALGFMRLSAAKWVFIIKQNDGNLRVMGIQPGSPAIIKNVAATSGTRGSGDKGATFVVRSIQNGPAPLYQGKFNLDRNSDDLSQYPMIYDEMIVPLSTYNGLPLTKDYYYKGEKLFTWHFSWNNNNLLINRHIQIHIC